MHHLGKGCDRRIVKRQSLEERAAIHRFWRLCRDPCDSVPISKHDKTAEPADHVHLGVPFDLIAVIPVGSHPHIDGSRRSACIGYGSTLDIFHPDFRDVPRLAAMQLS